MEKLKSLKFSNNKNTLIDNSFLLNESNYSYVKFVKFTLNLVERMETMSVERGMSLDREIIKMMSFKY